MVIFPLATLNPSNDIRVLLGPEEKTRAKLVTHVLYPEEWLDSKDPNDEKGRTHREVSEEVESYCVSPMNLSTDTSTVVPSANADCPQTVSTRGGLANVGGAGSPR